MTDKANAEEIIYRSEVGAPNSAYRRCWSARLLRSASVRSRRWRQSMVSVSLMSAAVVGMQRCTSNSERMDALRECQHSPESGVSSALNDIDFVEYVICSTRPSIVEHVMVERHSPTSHVAYSDLLATHEAIEV